MKLGILVLVVLGVVAAACAAILVGALNVNPSEAATAPTGMEVAVARHSLAPMTTITREDIVIQRVQRGEQSQSLDPNAVIGRVLGVPVVAGQYLPASCFVPEGSVTQLLAQMRDGMRLYTLNLNSRSVPDPFFFYPGCVVDVLFSQKLSGRDVPGQAMAVTMLQRLQVLGINGESIVSKPDKAEETKTRPAGGNTQVTLLVDQNQAEALQVLADNGNISLAVRNPLDKTTRDMLPTVLDQGRIVDQSSALTPEGVASSQSPLDWLAMIAPKDPNQAKQANPVATGEAATAAPVMSQPPFQQQQRGRPNPQWKIDVIRGKESKTEEFEVSQGGISG